MGVVGVKIDVSVTFGFEGGSCVVPFLLGPKRKFIERCGMTVI